MKYKVRVSKVCYGEVVVEASSEEDAKTVASGACIDYFDEEVTDMTAEPLDNNQA